MRRACGGLRRPRLAGLLLSCTVGPDYHRPPAVGLTTAFKEAPPGWATAQPQDAATKGAWWSIYHDPCSTGWRARSPSPTRT